MNREDISKLAREAGFTSDAFLPDLERFFQAAYDAGAAAERKAMMQLFTDPENQPTQHGTVTVEYMQREIAAERAEFAVHAVNIARGAVKEEREACAALCERIWPGIDRSGHEWSDGFTDGTCDCAAAIRARGQT